jgi:integrase/recombinase XerC/integrase/recombinase XerD
MKINEVICSFINDADVNEASRKMYDFCIKKYIKWVQVSKKDIEKLTRADVINYKSHLQATTLSLPTIKNYFTVVRIFYAWAESYNILENIAANIKSPKTNNSFKKYPLTFQEQDKLLASVDRLKEKGARDYAMISLLLNNGLRRAEIVSINIEDIKTRHGKMGIEIKGKGRDDKDQWIMLIPHSHEAIWNYLTYRKWKPCDPLFTSLNASNRGNRIDQNSVSKIIKDHLVKIGLDSKYYTCHSLRHTAACNLIEKGLDITQVRLFMRHNSIATTQLYTRVVEERISQNNPAGKIMQSLRNNNS